MGNILGRKVKGHNVSHVKQQGRRDFHRRAKAQMELLKRNTASKGEVEGVTTLDLLSHASRATDVLSPCPA